MQIKAEHLSYVYSEKSKSLAVKAIDDVTLTINEGEFFGIIGRTGSGKSTFVQHLNGLIKVGKNKGNLVVGDFDLTDKKCDFKALRAKVGMVFQYPEYQLFAETVEDDVAFALKNFYPKMTAEERQEAVRQAISVVGLDYKMSKNIRVQLNYTLQHFEQNHSVAVSNKHQNFSLLQMMFTGSF